MKKLVFIALFTFINVFAQTPARETSELTSDGMSKIRVKPDVAVLTVTVEKENESEKTALKDLNDEVNKLQKFFTKLALSPNSVKISDYNVTSNHYGDDKKQYVARNTLIIEFKLDGKVLDAFYQELQAGGYKDIDVDFDTELSKELEKTTRKILVQQAIEDAKANADNISKTLGVKIVNIKSVSKFGNDLPFRSLVEEVKYKPVAAAMMDAPAPTSFSKFEVVEKELQESITIVFAIEKL